MYPLFFIYALVCIIMALIICLFQEVHYVLIFNIVWRYTYSIRLFLIEAKHRYKGKNINRKHTLKIYIRLFHSASPHQALAGSALRLLTRGTSVLPQQTTKQLFFWLMQKGAFVQTKLRPILRWLCWFKSSGSILGLVSQVQWCSNDDFLRPISDQ